MTMPKALSNLFYSSIANIANIYAGYEKLEIKKCVPYLSAEEENIGKKCSKIALYGTSTISAKYSQNSQNTTRLLLDDPVPGATQND